MKVIITDSNFSSDEPERKVLEQIGLSVERYQCKSAEDMIEAGKDADAVIIQFAPLTEQVLKAWKKCKIIVRYGIGYDNVDVQAAEQLGIQVCNVPSYCLNEVADHTCTLILASLRKVHSFDYAVRQGVWDVEKVAGSIKSFEDTTIGLLGFGRIGMKVAERLKPFGFALNVFDPYLSEESAARMGVKLIGKLAEILALSDVISLHLPLTNETRHILNERNFALMKKHALLVNTSRGGLIHTVDLANALNARTIGFAALDVFEQEPLPLSHPLQNAHNIMFTPHAAYYSDTSLIRLQQQAAEEIVRWYKREPLASPVNKPVGR